MLLPLFSIIALTISGKAAQIVTTMSLSILTHSSLITVLILLMIRWWAPVHCLLQNAIFHRLAGSIWVGKTPNYQLARNQHQFSELLRFLGSGDSGTILDPHLVSPFVVCLELWQSRVYNVLVVGKNTHICSSLVGNLYSLLPL